MVASIVLVFIINVRLNLLCKRLQNSAHAHVHGKVDRFAMFHAVVSKHLHAVVFIQFHHVCVPHGNDVGASPLNDKFQSMAHQTEGEVQSTVGRGNGQPSYLKG